MTQFCVAATIAVAAAAVAAAAAVVAAAAASAANNCTPHSLHSASKCNAHRTAIVVDLLQLFAVCKVKFEACFLSLQLRSRPTRAKKYAFHSSVLECLKATSQNVLKPRLRMY